jgi:hypothetical protein
MVDTRDRYLILGAPTIGQEELIAGLHPQNNRNMTNIFPGYCYRGVGDLIGSYEKSVRL